MPYRRLPNTDSARMRALSAAYKKGKELPPFKLAFSQSTLQKAQSFLPSFEKAMHEAKLAFSSQVTKNIDYLQILRKAKLYISHFIQVVNMAALRGDLPLNEKSFFGIPLESQKLPELNSESDVIKWGEKIIFGESLRKSKSLSPITNPNIAIVNVRYEQFLDAYKHQKMLQKNYNRAKDKLSGLRDAADEIILKIWDEVEMHFADLPEEEKRAASQTYGLIYVFRKSEQLKNTSEVSN